MAKAKKSARKLSAREQLEAALEHQRAGRFDRAQQICEQLLARTPKLAPAHAILGALALSRGAPEAALASLDRAIALEHGHVGAHLNRGNALRALGRDAEAAQAYRTALALDGSSAFAHNNLANLLRDHGRLDEAIASYERALALDPGLYAAAANLASVLAGRAASPGSEPASRERAIEAHERALAIAGARGLRDLSVATCHNTLGNLLLAAGRTADALASYRRAIELDPAFGEAHLNLGALLARPGSVEDALTHLRRGLELKPDYLPAYERLAMLLRRLGRGDEALAVYRAWHALDPADPIARHMAQLGQPGREPPERCDDAYVRKEFDELAASFDATLAELEYRAPALVGQAILRTPLSAPAGLHVLDAGCGTGLCAPFLRPLAARLSGVDLSSKMLDVARGRALYDELVEAELVRHLEANEGAFDLIVAADVLTYFGRLEPLALAARRALRPAGVLIFTVEASEDPSSVRDYALDAAGRYVHREGYVTGALEAAALHVREIEHVVLRKELGEDVAGRLFVATA